MNSQIKYIKEVAQKALVSADCMSLPVDVKKVAEKFGLSVIEFDFIDSISGVLKKDRNVIGVNKKHSKVRQRFTIAHELGHFLLGHDIGKNEDILDDNSEKPIHTEREANIFASELLMPHDLLVNEVKKEKIDLKRLASIFDVSEQAISIRLLNSNLI